MTFSMKNMQKICRSTFARFDSQSGTSLSAPDGTESRFTSRRLEQDVEIFLFSGRDANDLQKQIDHLLIQPVPSSRQEFIARAHQFADQQHDGPVRGAVVAGNAGELYERLRSLKDQLQENTSLLVDMQQGSFLGSGDGSVRIGFLFTGQTAPPYRDGGLMRRRFRFIDEFYSWARLPQEGDENETTTAQPALIVSSLAAIALLDQLGISAKVGVGHSLGELIALYWAGAMDKDTLMDMTCIRSEAMVSGSPTGGGLAIKTGREQIEPWLSGKTVFISGIMGPQLTMVSGEASGIAEVADIAKAQNIPTTRMPLTHAFHSPCIQSAVPIMAEYLANIQFHGLQNRVISTVFARELAPEADLVDLLCQQIVSPICLMPAIQLAAEEVDVFIEVGPGKIISTFAAQCTPVPSYPIDAGGTSLRDLLHVVGYAFVLGIPVKTDALFADL